MTCRGLVTPTRIKYKPSLACQLLSKIPQRMAECFERSVRIVSKSTIAQNSEKKISMIGTRLRESNL